MIKVLFFASYREKLGCDSLQLESYPQTLTELRTMLAEKGPQWQQVLQDKKTLVAHNQTMTRKDFSISAGDEIAFFPPVTGG